MRMRTHCLNHVNSLTTGANPLCALFRLYDMDALSLRLSPHIECHTLNLNAPHRTVNDAEYKELCYKVINEPYFSELFCFALFFSRYLEIVSAMVYK